MTDVSLGELFTIKTHPFPTTWKFTEDEKKSVLIGADASFIPPIMVACETLNSSEEHDVDTGIKQTNQVRGIFYSHKTHKFEKHWFKVSELKNISNEKFKDNKIEISFTESLQNLRKLSIGAHVILRSVDVELNKEKVSQERRNFESVNLKRSPYLDFVPPVMTVIDVRISEPIKDNYYKNSGRQKRVISKFEFKCKYYNSNSNIYSEEWLPHECLADVTNNFKLDDSITLKDKYTICTLKKEVKFENSTLRQTQTVVKLKEIVFNHYEYSVKAEDIWTHKILDIDIANPVLLNEGIDIDKIMDDRIPNNLTRYPLPPDKFSKDNLYEIEYLSDRGSASKRLIYIVDKHPINEETDTLIIANCLLRNGKLRHFKVSNIKSSRRVKGEFENLFITYGGSDEE